MKPETALKLADRLTREMVGLQTTVDQLSHPDTGTTIAGLKSGLTITLRSVLRTNRIIHDVIRASVTPPSAGNPLDRLFR